MEILGTWVPSGSSPLGRLHAGYIAVPCRRDVPRAATVTKIHTNSIAFKIDLDLASLPLVDKGGVFSFL